MSGGSALVATAAGVIEAATVARLVAAVGDAATGRAPHRLGPDAVEIEIETDWRSDATLGALTRMRGAVEGLAIDVNAVALAGRRKRLLIADMDSTIIGCECIDEIADAVGVKPQVAAITEQAMRGEVDFEGALRARVALLEGASEDVLHQVYAERVRLNPGARALATTMARDGAATALVSGGFVFFAERVAAAAGFHTAQANRLEAVDGRLTGRTTPPILGRAAKSEALERLSAERGLSPGDALAIGDGANDLAMIGAAGLGVAYRAKPVVAAEADARLDHSPLTAALYLQGYRAEEMLSDAA